MALLLSLGADLKHKLQEATVNHINIEITPVISFQIYGNYSVCTLTFILLQNKAIVLKCHENLHVAHSTK